ncbi:MAG: hypothetical protein ACXWL2_01585 [Candidatus Chromulinivorax sp.]
MVLDQSSLSIYDTIINYKVGGQTCTNDVASVGGQDNVGGHTDACNVGGQYNVGGHTATKHAAVITKVAVFGILSNVNI